MKEIKILGIGCAKCNELFQNAEKAVRELGIEVTLTKITDLKEIMSYGVMMTPGLVIDGKVKTCGKVPSIADIRIMLEK
jgi:small redox-active disulfide protein 2